MKSVLAIDQGTTGSTCLVIRQDGRVLGRAYSEFTQHFPRPGWVEHDAAEIWEVTRSVVREAVEAAGTKRACTRPGSRTSGRRSSSGTGRVSSRSTGRSCGRTAAPPGCAGS